MPIHIDFLSGKVAYRAKHATRRNELLARALNISPREQPLIVDATAGLGRDSFILASLGYDVIMIERSPILHQLLTDAMERAKTDPATAAIIARMTLIHADAKEWLVAKNYSRSPDIIYLDPMFPERKKSASVKKEMLTLQELLGKDTDCAMLFEAAMDCAKRRVVVKRPRLAENITARAPDYTLKGNSSRFDIYLTKNSAE
jgi:16S rRNA (guanine1516-N2)-methyltransferase